jgi:hypothetical protein
VTTRARWIAGVVGAVVALNAVLAGLDRLTRDPSGPRSSSYATAPDGVAAFADLIARSGAEVNRLRDPLTDRALARSDTLVLLEPRAVARGEKQVLRRFLQRGGRVVAGGAGSDRWLRPALGPGTPRWRARGVARAHVLAPVPETAGVTAVMGAGAGGWSDARAFLPVLGAAGAPPLAVAGTVGRGRLILLADASPLQNRWLGVADNAAFALSVAGRGHVTFAEAAHGYGHTRGLAALPARWKVALLGLVLAALVWLLSRARRLGPPEDAARALPPPRRLHVEAVAAALRRTRRRDEASAPVAEAARARLAQRARLSDAAAEAQWHAAGREAGLNDAEIAALLGPAGDEQSVLARGRALSKLGRGGA